MNWNYICILIFNIIYIFYTKSEWDIFLTPRVVRTISFAYCPTPSKSDKSTDSWRKMSELIKPVPNDNVFLRMNSLTVFLDIFSTSRYLFSVLDNYFLANLPDKPIEFFLKSAPLVTIHSAVFTEVLRTEKFYGADAKMA